MPNRTHKLIELVGSSDRSYAEATKNAIKKAGETLQGLSWFEVMEQRGAIRDGKIEFQVKLKVAFRLMEKGELEGAEAAKPARRR